METITASRKYNLDNMNVAAQDILLGNYLQELTSKVSGSGTITAGSITGSYITAESLISGCAQFGNGNNKSTFDANGYLTMSGSARAWDDLFFPLITGKQGATDKPPFNNAEIAYMFPQNDATNIIYLNIQFPHSWSIGTEIIPHVHWKQASAGSVVFKMEYNWFDLGAVVPDTFKTYVMNINELPYTSGSIHQLTTGSAHVSGSHINLVSSMMLVKLYREDNTYTGAAATYQFDLHIQRDSMGSRNETSK